MGPKNLETKFLPKKAFCSILSLYTTVTSCKKSKNVTPWLLMVPEKIHSGPLLLEKFQNKVTLKKSFGLISGLYIAITSCKKSEKFHVITFRPILGPSWPEPLKHFYQKNHLGQLWDFMQQIRTSGVDFS